MPVPNTDCSLLVASAETGGRPTESRAGSAIMPPPPAMASTKPASRPTAARASRIRGSSILSWIRLWGERDVGDAPLVDRNIDHGGHEPAHHQLKAGHQSRHGQDDRPHG